MSELANFNQSDLSALTPEQKSAFAETLTKAGFDPAAVEQKLGPAAVTAPSHDATGSNAKPAASQPILFNVPDDALSPQQKLQGAETLRRAGVSEDIIDAALKGQHFETNGPTQTDYNLNYGSRASSIEDLPALNAEITKGFATGGILPSEAQPLLDAMLDAIDLYGGSVDEKFVYANEASKLNRLMNSEEVIRTAKIAYNALPAEFRNRMAERHAFDSAAAYLALSRVGQMKEYRKSKN